MAVLHGYYVCTLNSVIIIGSNTIIKDILFKLCGPIMGQAHQLVGDIIGLPM